MVKMNNGAGSVMMVFTGETPEQIIRNGVVTTQMPFDLLRSENVKYVVCCQDATIEGSTEPHNAAFLIGIVSETFTAERNGKLMGVSLGISHYVLVTKRDAWYPRRNVTHLFIRSLQDAKIRLGRYDFTPIEQAPKRATIVTAKRPASAMASRVATGKGLRKVEKFPVTIDTEGEEIAEDITNYDANDIRALVAKRLGLKPSQVNVTVTISI